MDIIFNSVQTVEIPSNDNVALTDALNALALACFEESDYFTFTVSSLTSYISSKKCKNLFEIYRNHDDSTYKCLGGKCMVGQDFNIGTTREEIEARFKPKTTFCKLLQYANA